MGYKSLFDVWRYGAEEYGGAVLFSDNTGNISITYNDAFRRMCFLAERFKQSGLKRFDKVCLFAVNSPDWLILEQAVISLGAVCVSKSPDVSVNEFEYIFLNSDSCALITDNNEITEHFAKNIPGFYNKVKFIIYTGKEKIEAVNPKIVLLKDILSELNENTIVKTDFEENPEDTAYINYTSGTSAASKGAMLSNYGMVYAAEEILNLFPQEKGKLFISVHHPANAGWKSPVLSCMLSGCRIIFTNYKDFWETIKKYKPDYLHIAPKVIQTMHSMFMQEVKNRGRFFEYLFNKVYLISEKILKSEKKHQVCFEIIKTAADKLFFKPVRNTLLKDDVLISTGSAHLAEPSENFLRIMNISYIQHYGLTETTGIAVSNTLESSKNHPYTVGKPFSKTILKIINPETKEEVKAGETGLITLRAPSILKGYYKNEEASKKAMPDGETFITSDLGFIDEEGFLTVLSRYDDVIVLSNGYDVYAPLLDNEMKDSEFVLQSVTAGHKKPYLVSLIVLNTAEYQKWGGEGNPNEDKKFKEFLLEHINEKIKRKKNYRYYEKIKKVYFLIEGFTIENGLLTSTLKIKYKSVLDKYRDVIENLYEEENI